MNIKEMSKRIDKLEAELEESAEFRKQAEEMMQAWMDEAHKLQAVVDSLSDALRKAGNLADIERWYERYPLVYGSMTDAIKESNDE